MHIATAPAPGVPSMPADQHASGVLVRSLLIGLM